MIYSLFYKEWIKTRRILLLAVVVFTCFIIYTFINIGQMFRVGGAIQAWTDVLLKDISLLSKMQWLPVVFSILFAIAQFAPEMANKRLKLTLHLPMPENKIMSVMLSYGLFCLLVLYAIVYIALMIGLQIYYPSEIVLASFETSLPWFLSGLMAYLFVAWICIEPTWRQRVFNSLIGIYALTFFMTEAKSGAMMPFVPYLIVFIVIAMLYPFYSMSRFKEGAQ